MIVKRGTSNQKALLEAITNVIVGFIIGVSLNIFLLPVLLGIPTDVMSFDLAVTISLLYGSTGLVRSFILRKAFSKYVRKNWRIF